MKALDEADVIEMVRKSARRAGSMRAMAREWDVTVSYISDLLNGRRAPGPKILDPLGIDRVKIITYQFRPKSEGPR